MSAQRIIRVVGLSLDERDRVKEVPAEPTG